MKRLLLALALCGALLIPPTAAAADPGTDRPGTHTKAGCGGYETKQGYLLSVDWSGNSLQWGYEAKVYYRLCTDQLNRIYAKAEQYFVYGDAGSQGCTHMLAQDVNPNVIGGWNPGMKTSPKCNDVGGKHWALTWNAPAGHSVYPSAPSADRCLGAVVTMDFSNIADRTRTLPSLCII